MDISTIQDPNKKDDKTDVFECLFPTIIHVIYDTISFSGSIQIVASVK
jgi:hypothetical protein